MNDRDPSIPEPSANGQVMRDVPSPLVSKAGVGRGPTQAEVLIGYARDAELFHAPDGGAYATVGMGGHRETPRCLKSSSFRSVRLCETRSSKQRQLSRKREAASQIKEVPSDRGAGGPKKRRPQDSAMSASSSSGKISAASTSPERTCASSPEG